MAITREQRTEIERQLRSRERDLDHAEAGRNAGELRAIARAMQAMREGEYGHCTDCGADIPFERLCAEPTALRCVRCQTLGERKFAHPQPGTSL